MNCPDAIARKVHTTFENTQFHVPSEQWTALASFVLVSTSSLEVKVISLATGSRCLPAERISGHGDALHDCHAEVLARRGAVKWFLHQVSEYAKTSYSPWLRKSTTGLLDLEADTEMYLYVSTLPCGDASTRSLASVQDEDMAALKNTSGWDPLPAGKAARGRDNYSLLGVLRTKPGRADSLPTKSMSCSDKIALWNAVGIQGALGTTFFAPLYLSGIVLGGVPLGMRDLLREDCDRAFHGRLGSVANLPAGYAVRRPRLYFTSVPFVYAKSNGMQKSCVESLCWIADPETEEALINGYRRGVSPKHRHNPKFRPILSKLAFLSMHQCLSDSAQEKSSPSMSYSDVKSLAADYQQAKCAVCGPAGPFCAWVKTLDEETS